MGPRTLPSVLAAICLGVAAPAQGGKPSPYEEDVRFAIKDLETRCGALLKAKGIDWKKATDPLLKEAKATKDDVAHAKLLQRLVARLRDGHAEVRPTERTKGLKFPEERRVGPGFFLCRVGERVHLKNVFGGAAAAGLAAGSELVSVGGKPAGAWLAARAAAAADATAFSTDAQAFFHACHWGLAEPPGTRLDLETRDLAGRTSKRAITYANAAFVPDGPAYPPEGYERAKDVGRARTKRGFGYVHVRRSPSDLPEQLDLALAAAADAPGLIVDFRGNSGGGFDHAAFMGRFVPSGKTWTHEGVSYPSAGPKPFAGPVVAIVDATVRSAGETAVGSLKEDGRAYVIGECPTAGMASQKALVELPSGLFALYVSVASNKGRFNGGKGIEGIGVIPHRVVAFDPKDLAAGVDTLIKVAEDVLGAFPQKDVPYEAKLCR